MASLDTTAKSTDATPTQALRVLVVDENETDRQDTVLHLGKAWPFEAELLVEFAADGQEAIGKIAAARFSLIVLDWRAPETPGGDWLRTFRQAGVRIPLVIISDLRRHQILDDIETLGAAFLNKAEMDSVNFRDAIASSWRMIGRPNPASATSIQTETSPPSAPHETLRPTQ